MSDKQPIGPNQRKWLDALRSGKYEQGTEFLCRNGEFCCLGVGCKVFEVPEFGEGEVRMFGNERANQFAPIELMDLLALRDNSGPSLTDGDELVEMNDSGVTFDAIADAIESDPHEYFTEPR